ncbi:MAG: triose-phosphate isomerase [Actinobacteria bacterium]|jgi:triosephosphate isomerase|nr:triose-phosphate isomerase [Actinomycetota bacterium]
MSNERTPIVSGNWKMNNNHFEAIQCVQKLAYLLQKEDFEAAEVTVHPPFTDLRSIQTLIDADQLRMKLGAQNCHPDDKGAYTGEISPVFLSKLGVQYVIVGHSERRELFGESDEFVARKVAAVQKHGMTPILCVGETLEEREAGTTLDKVKRQIRVALDKRSSDQVKTMVIAYEPIWAIGTGKNATPADAQEVVAAIREEVAAVITRPAAQAVRIQYGGSVKAGTAADFMRQPDIDGLLVGGASLDPTEFARIVQYRRHSF